MYQGKHLTQKTKKKAAVSYRKRRVALILSLALILTASIGGTMAYFMDSEWSISNFTVGKVSCTVDVADDNCSVKVTNTENVPAYVRVAVVANWVSDTDPNAIHYTQPQVGVGSDAGWTYNSVDGFYYYNASVGANQAVTLPIYVTGTAPDGYKVQIQALAEAIQSNAAADAWKFSPSGN